VLLSKPTSSHFTSGSRL